MKNWPSHNLHYMISWKDLENLEKFPCAKNKDESNYWMPVTFMPSGITALKKYKSVMEIGAWAQERLQKCRLTL